MRSAFLTVFAGLGAVLLSACGGGNVSGPVDVELIRPTGVRCGYEIAPARIQTLQSLREMRGLVGQVVYSDENVKSRPEILDSGASFRPVDSQFSRSGSVYSPLDLASLFAASLYWAVEQGHLLFSRLDPSADMTQVVPDFAQSTRIVHDARRTFGKVGADDEITDNAEYLSHRIQSADGEKVLNYLFSFPTNEVEDMPLGLNTGIMVHEYSHLVMHHLFYEPAFARDMRVSTTLPTTNTLSALDEGIADYFGFLATGDPHFFLCSFANSNRDLTVPKSFSDSVISGLEGNAYFSPHEGGAVWAAINYEIGQQIGFEENGRLIIQLMKTLATCPSAVTGSNSIGLDFGIVAQCHANVSGTYSGVVSQTYARYLGKYGRGR